MQCIRYETLSAPISMVVSFFARVKKEFALREMFCMKKEKSSTITGEIRQGLGRGKISLFILLF